MIQILVVDEQQVKEHSITKTLASQPDFEIIGTVSDVYETLRQVKFYTPDIIFLDEGFVITNNTNILPLIKAASPKSRVILLTSVPEGDLILEAIRHGASGYILKNSAEECFIDGTRIVYDGGSLMSSETIALAFQSGQKSDGEKNGVEPVPVSGDGVGTGDASATMSRQEMRLITCIGQGLSTKEIAKNLRLKDGTIRNYISTIFHKTGLRNRAEVALFARTGRLWSDRQGRRIRRIIPPVLQG
jgi:DNA-binding NarL/FixJ family response regulator